MNSSIVFKQLERVIIQQYFTKKAEIWIHTEV